MDLLDNLFVDEIKIPNYQVDFDRKITLPSVFLLLQDIAWKHASKHGFGFEDLQEKKMFWVLSKIQLVMHRYPQWTDVLRIETWAKEPDLLTAFRDFEGFDERGEKLFSATSAWHILSMAGNRPQRMDEFKREFPIPAGKEAIATKPEKLPAPENPQQTTALPVLISDIDMNLHVNNTRYIQWVLDSFPFDFVQQHRVAEITVNFLLQAKIGDSYVIATDAQPGNIFTSSVLRVSDGKELARLKTIWHKQ